MVMKKKPILSRLRSDMNRIRLKFQIKSQTQNHNHACCNKSSLLIVFSSEKSRKKVWFKVGTIYNFALYNTSRLKKNILEHRLHTRHWAAAVLLLRLFPRRILVRTAVFYTLVYYLYPGCLLEEYAFQPPHRWYSDNRWVIVLVFWYFAVRSGGKKTSIYSAAVLIFASRWLDIAGLGRKQKRRKRNERTDEKPAMIACVLRIALSHTAQHCSPVVSLVRETKLLVQRIRWYSYAKLLSINSIAAGLYVYTPTARSNKKHRSADGQAQHTTDQFPPATTAVAICYGTWVAGTASTNHQTMEDGFQSRLSPKKADYLQS